MPGFWSSVFLSASSVAEQVEKEADLNPAIFSKKRKIHREDDENETGAFKQPVKLARFIQSTLPVESTESCTLPEVEGKDSIVSVMPNDEVAISEEIVDAKSEGKENLYMQLSLEERCARQICRKWLKYVYLGTNQPCDSSCGRIHGIPDNPQKLYKDFSFKGLPPKQQKKIFAAIKAKKDTNEV